MINKGLIRLGMAIFLVLSGAFPALLFSQDWSDYQELYKPIQDQQALGPAWKYTLSKSLFEKLYGPSIDYLIIVRDELKTAILPLAEWKQKKGLKTKIVTLSQIGIDPGFEEIYDYIKGLYAKSPTPIIYLLLAGDAEDIPPHYREDDTGTSYDGLVMSDMFYGIMKDGLFPDIRVGRFPALTAEEMGLMVQKTLNYEKNPDLSLDWFSRALVFGCEIETESYGFEDAALLQESGYECAEIISQGYADLEAKQVIIGEFNQGLSLAVYYGHGDPWYMRGFDDQSLNALDNGARMPLFISGGCSTAQFDLEINPYVEEPQGPETSIAEALMREPWGGGAVAYIGCGRVGGPGYEYKFFNGCFWGLVNNGHAGVIMDTGKMVSYLASSWAEQDAVNNEESRQYDLENFNLLGDPELPIRTQWPHRFQVIISEFAYPIYTTGQYSPVKGAQVCLRKEGNNFLAGETDADGNINFLPPASWQSFDVTVTAGDFIPHSITYQKIALKICSTGILDPQGKIKIKVMDKGPAPSARAPTPPGGR